MFKVVPKSVPSCFKNYTNFFIYCRRKLKSVPIHSKNMRIILKNVQMYSKSVPLTIPKVFRVKIIYNRFHPFRNIWAQNVYKCSIYSVLKCAKMVPNVRNLSFMYSLDTEFEQFGTLHNSKVHFLHILKYLTFSTRVSLSFCKMCF